MKKNNKKGFLLIETLVVSTFISAILIFLYIQFKNIYYNYDVTFKYNNVNSLYSTNHIRNFLSNSNYEILRDEINKGELYVDISTCPSLYIFEVEYCQNLFAELDVKKAYFASENLNSLIHYSKQNSEFNEDMIVFLEYINFDKNSNGYRIVAQFNDNTFASVNIGG